MDQTLVPVDLSEHPRNYRIPSRSSPSTGVGRTGPDEVGIGVTVENDPYGHAQADRRSSSSSVVAAALR